MRGAASILLATSVTIGSLSAAGDGPVTAKPPRARPGEAARLLANVVHLSDNDVRFRTSNGVTVFVDPMAFAAEVAVRKAGRSSPDLILITHPHLDHFNAPALVDYVKRNPRLVVAGPPDVVRYAKANGIDATEVQPGREYTLARVTFRTVPAYHLEGTEHPRESGWVGYVVRTDGASLYVTGDTQPFDEMSNVGADVLMTPVFGCGSNIEQALTIVKLSAPKVAVPVHSGGQDDVINDFLARLPHGVQGASYKDGKPILARASATS